MPPQHDNSRNTIIFVVCALALLVLYQVFVMGPAQKRADLAEKARVAATAPGQLPGALALPGGATKLTREQALAASPRVAIDTPALRGSISLKGAALDDLYLKDYRAALDNPAPVELFRPVGAEFAYFIERGWTGQNLAGLPDINTVWTVKSGQTLSPGQPVVLTYDNGQGLVFDRKIEVDNQYMFTVSDTVTNRTGAAVTLAPRASVQRMGLAAPVAPGVHEGRISVMQEKGKYLLKVRKYAKWKKDNETLSMSSTGGWLGVTDKYWLAALIPDQKEQLTGAFRVSPVSGTDAYEAAYVGSARQIAPNYQTTEVSRIYAGAKRAEVLRVYRDQFAIPRLDDAIDWTNIQFITKPIFWMIELFYGWVGNFGIAILMMTVVVKLAFFYPANLSFASMTKMKKVQPQLEQLKAKHKDDPAGMQKAMMTLYREEKINPLLGCLPMLATIPVFLGLFYVLNVTIEMRHAPFFGWIDDLSDRDPTSIWTLFGLIPWEPKTVPLIGGFLDGPLHLGVWPLLYGFTMWLTQSMSPPAGDPMQQKILMWMPVIFTFVMAQFAAGLLIYYVWSNILTILQQYVIMRRFKVDNPIDQGIRLLSGKKGAG